jgi:hypothetical protein
MTLKEIAAIPHIHDRALRYGLERLISGNYPGAANLIGNSDNLVTVSIREKAAHEDANYSLVETAAILHVMVDSMREELDRVKAEYKEGISA